MAAAKLRVVLAEEQPGSRDPLCFALGGARDVSIIAEAGNGPAALLALKAAKPDALVISATLPPSGALEYVRRARMLLPGLRVLVVLPDRDGSDVQSFLDAGVQGLVERQAAPGEFLHALRAIAPGGLYLSAGLVHALVAERRSVPQDDLYGLTERETEVLRFISGGFSNKEIALRLALSVRTVETHRVNIRRKTGAERLRDLVHAARQLGLDRSAGLVGEAAHAMRRLRPV
jgi:DNA-binding NarL/FixJ family response regulator